MPKKKGYKTKPKKRVSAQELRKAHKTLGKMRRKK